MSEEKTKKPVWLYGLVAIIIIIFFYMLLAKENDTTGKSSYMTAQQDKKNNNEQTREYSAAPDFSLPDINGNQVQLSDFKGKVVFVNFWATWCPPCRMEIPYFIELMDQYGDQGFIVLGIALDPREFDKVKPFVEQMNITYPVVYDKTGVSRLYGGIQSIPTTFVVNRQGKVVEKIVGSRPKEVFENIIKQWL